MKKVMFLSWRTALNYKLLNQLLDYLSLSYSWHIQNVTNAQKSPKQNMRTEKDDKSLEMLLNYHNRRLAFLTEES
jgi:hypothetical protein